MGLSFGNQDPKAPVLGMIGGVHGLERIGSQVVLSLMHSLSELILWDRLVQEALKQIRIFFVPMTNPLGILHRSRANPYGIDLMRNAPVDAQGEATYLVGGHRISPRLPWYRGVQGEPMQLETQALFDFCKDQTFGSDRVIMMDCHSGFGGTDQIWFPYAKSTAPFPHLSEIYSFKVAFERTHPNHFYKIEPQAKNYTTHGDMWDYLYEEFYKQPDRESSVYLPLTLEMGSWAWVRKNPTQIFSMLGAFNPVQPHRLKRILRRHNTLFDFLIRALVSHQVWAFSNPDQREKHRLRAMEHWYGE